MAERRLIFGMIGVAATTILLLVAELTSRLP